MSTAGQAVGGLVGGIAGFFIGGPTGAVYGAQIGIMAGGYLDPPKGQRGTPPSADQLAVQTSTYGASLKRGYGTYATHGNVFWVKGNKLDAVEKKQKSGKGGSKQTASAWEIFGTFAVGFHLGEITAYKRIWFGSKLVYDAGSSDLGAIMATNEAGGSITLYTGTTTQLPDPLIQADMGVGSTPGYRGLAYIVVNNWPMAEWGNSLAGLQIKAELVVDGTISQYDRRVYVPSGLFSPYALQPGPYNPRVADGMVKFNKGTTEYTVDYEGDVVSAIGAAADFGAPYYIGQMPNGSGVLFDQNVSIGGGDLLVDGEVFKSRTGSTTDAFCGACVGGDGLLYVLMSTASVGRIEVYDEELTLLSTNSQTIYAGTDTGSLPLVPGSVYTFCVENSGKYLWKSYVSGGENGLHLYEISSAGALTLLWTYAGAFHGTYGDRACMAAADGVCFHVSNGGSLAIFDRARIITSSIVPLADVLRAECLQSGLLVTGDIDTSEITQNLRGYEIAQTASIRAALEPLQAAWPFDVIPHGYQIKFVPRGKSSIATIDISEIGAVAGNGRAVQITTSREMDSQLPRRVSVKYRNANREYDPDVGPGAERLNTDAINVVDVDLSLVMTEAEAAGIEQVLLYMYWLERHDVSFTLPPTYRRLEPTDVVTINGDSVTYVLRLKEITDLPDGRMECTAKYNAISLYTPNAVAQTTANPAKTLAFAGPSSLQLLDIPCVDSTAMNKPGLLTAVGGYYAGWPGGLLFRSDDAGQTWNDVQGFPAPGCVIGRATNSIGAASPYTVDTSSRLNIRLYSGALESVSEDVMFNGANHFAYGAHGRWEIIAAQTCTQKADATWTLTRLMRGRFGSERYMSEHAADDIVVLLDADHVRFVGMDIATMNVERLWRPVTSGRLIDTASETALAYTGVNLRPLSPVDLRGHRQADNGDWTVAWSPRTRTPVALLSGAAVPIGETSESYTVDFFDATWTDIKRTVSGLTSPSCPYTATQQIADFGVIQTTLYPRIRQISQTAGAGYDLAQSLWVNSPVYSDFRVAGFHFDGSNGSTAITEQSGRPVSVFGNAQISTAQYAPLTGNTSSLLLDGTGDYLTVPDSADFSFGAGNFTIRFWCRPTSSGSDREILAQRINGATSFFYIRHTTAGNIRVVAVNGGTTITDVISMTTLTNNVWTFVEIVRTGGSVKISLGGTFGTTVTTDAATAWPDSASVLYIGIGNDLLGATNFFAGYLDDLEIYKGYAMHTANFTPPTAPF